jgi:surfeit locus 1 family protein
VTRTRIVLLGIVALAIAAVCIRLGIWQLDRLAQRRLENARVAAGIVGEPVDMEAVGGDSTRSRALRVRLRGRYDFEHEIVLINRSRDGSPGVNLLTPLRLEGRDTAVLVNRGWVYSPDGSTVDPSRWREPVEAAGTAWVSWLPVYGRGASARSSANETTARRVLQADRQVMSGMLPYPIAPYQLVLIDEAAMNQANGYGGNGGAAPLGTETPIDPTRPVRIPLPSLDEGPHKSYALQWFAFAAIALIGTGAVARNEWARPRGDSAL